MKRKLHISAISLKGGRANNEDNFYFKKRHYPEIVTNDERHLYTTKEKRGYFAVADGMGGLSGGEEASKTAMLYLQSHKKLLLKSPQVFFNRINKKVRKASRGGGTTFSCAIINKDNTIDVFTIGDSPVLLFKYATKEIFQVNKFDNRAADLDPAECDPLVYEQGKRQLLAFLGCGRYQKDVPFHYYNLKDIQIGDILMLCSDGIDTVPSDQIKMMCDSRANNFPSLAEGLAETAVVNASRINRCSDNTSVVCVEFID